MNIWEFLVWIFWVYILIACIWIFITIIIDIFRDPSLNGWAKALWVVFLVFLPFLAAFIYLIARGRSMTERRVAEMKDAQAAQNSYIRSPERPRRRRRRSSRPRSCSTRVRSRRPSSTASRRRHWPKQHRRPPHPHREGCGGRLRVRVHRKQGSHTLVDPTSLTDHYGSI